MNGLRKRIGCVFLALFVVVFALLSRPVKVQASSVALPSAGSAESLMALLDLLINSMIAGGASEAVADYDSEMDLLDAFLNFAHSFAPVPEVEELKFCMQDGSIITLQELCDSYTDGTGALQLPDEETWSNLRVIDGGAGNGGGSNEQNPQEPEAPQGPDFSNLETFVINSGFLAMVGDFFTSLWNGELDGLDYGTYAKFESVYYSGRVPKDANGYYGYIGAIGPCYADGTGSLTVSYSSPNRMCGFIDKNSYMKFLCGNESNTYSAGNILSNNTSGMYYREGYTWYNFNFPVFPDEASAKLYLQTGVDTGCLNGLCYDYPALVNSIPTALAPLAGLELAPSSLQSINTALNTAVDPFPLPDIEPAENTSQYQDAVNVAIGDFVATLPEPEPEPDPEPEPEPEPDPDASGGSSEIDNYKRDLRSLFPFCLPFDLIALLDALDADPVAPCFEIPFIVDALDISMTVELDLSFLDEVAELMRLFETIGFIITLIMVTHKLIKW